jgi:hypothetical protein
MALLGPSREEGCGAKPPPSPASRVPCLVLRNMPSPLPRRKCQVPLSLASLARLDFPLGPQGRLPHRLFRGLIGRSLTLRPAASQSRLRDPFHRRLRQLRFLHCRSDCYWASDPSQTGLPPAEPNKFPRRTDHTSPFLPPALSPLAPPPEVATPARLASCATAPWRTPKNRTTTFLTSRALSALLLYYCIIQPAAPRPAPTCAPEPRTLNPEPFFRSIP